jgi:hypothetical protein
MGIEGTGGPGGGGSGGAPGGGDAAGDGDGDAHWVRWHRSYEDPDSSLSARLRLVQSGVRSALDEHDPGPIRVISICAGQGRDVIDVVAGHPRRADVRALLVERDPDLVAFARRRAAEAGVGDQVRVVEGDASLVSSYDGWLPADVVLICGVFGNISDGDIRSVVSRLPSFCARGATVIWTRHRRPPDLTPAIREWFAEAGFEERSFAAPDPYVLSVGCHRFGGTAPGTEPPPSLDTERPLFTFVGDGSLPA